MAEAITGKPTPSYSAARKKRTEETRGGFKSLIPIIRRRIHRPPPLPERLWLSDTLDWLQQWAAFEDALPTGEPIRPDNCPGDGGFSPSL